MRGAFLAGVGVLAVALAGCGGGDKSPAVAPTGPGVYVAQAGTADRGTRFVYEIPAPLEDYAVSRVERLRAALGAPPASYVLLGVDASRAVRDVAIDLGAPVAVVAPGGARVVYEPAPRAIESWLSAAGAKVTPEVRAEAAQLSRDYQLGAITLPGTVGKTVLVTDGPTPAVDRIVTGFLGTGNKPLEAHRVSAPRKAPVEIQQR